MMIITTSIEGGMSNAIMPDKVQNICAQINRLPACLAGHHSQHGEKERS